MRFFVKLKSPPLGKPLVRREVAWPLDGAAEEEWWDLIRRTLKIPEDAWGVTVEVNILMDLSASNKPAQSEEDAE